MPDKLFFNTGIPVSLWFVSKDRHGNGHRKREGEVLFIDARKLGRMETRRLRVLDDADIARIADTYHAWRNHDGGYEDVPGFCKAASLDEIRAARLRPHPRPVRRRRGGRGRRRADRRQDRAAHQGAVRRVRPRPRARSERPTTAGAAASEPRSGDETLADVT